MVIKKAYKFRLYPTKEQVKTIDKTMEECRLLYNKLLALKKDTYEKKGISLSQFDLNNQIKGKNKWIHSQVVQNISDRLNKAFQHFFRRLKQGAKKKGFPRFKKYGTRQSITLPQIINSKRIGKKTYFPKIGWINTKYHRKINGTPKTMTIKKVKSGKYFLTICCANVNEKLTQTTDKAVGIDLGLNHFIATSDGESFEHPKPLKQLSKKRKALSRCFSKTKKKTNNRNKVRVKLARVDEKIVNIRNEFGWKLCNTLIKKYGTIYCEDLNIKGMVKNHCLAEAITDVSWADFLQKLSFKAECAGGKVVKVDPKNTSQKCSKCGNTVKKSLAIRIHNCPLCGLKIERDINAARNILTKGKIGQELPKLKPERDETSTVGIKPTASIVNETGSYSTC